jgi:Flp pilus assembly protein TadG
LAGRLDAVNVLRRIFEDESGQALVEFAIVLPLLLLILFGIFDFGRIILDSFIINEAARDAARYASAGASDSAVVQVVNQDCALLDTSKLGVTIVPAAAARVSGGTVTVTVTYPVSFDPFLSFLTSGPFNLTGQTTMRVE